jgi:hypothetical protein
LDKKKFQIFFDDDVDDNDDNDNDDDDNDGGDNGGEREELSNSFRRNQIWI